MRARRLGFRSKMKTKGGRALLSRRRKKAEEDSLTNEQKDFKSFKKRRF